MSKRFYICIKQYYILMKAVLYVSGKIGKDTTLVDVIRQYKSFEDVTEIEAVIHSEGGSVDEGDGIYNYLKGLGAEVPVTTITDKAYSIAAKIFTAGSTRIVEDVDNALMIHFAWAEVEGNAEKLELVAEALRGMENDFAGFYSEFLSVDESTVRNLLDNETFVSGEEAVELGFATEMKTAAKAVAEYNIQNSNNNKMSENKNVLKKLVEAMASFLGNEDVEINAELTLQDSNGADIVFPDLDEGANPGVGDKATIDGSAIPDGSYIMPSLEGATVVFEGGAIVEVKPVEETEEEPSVEVEASEKPEEETTEINAEEIQEISVWTVNVTNSSFAEGDVVEYSGMDGESYPVSSGEFQLKDGRRIVTDASGKIVSIKGEEEVVEEEEQAAPTEDGEETAAEIPAEVAPEASFDELLEKVTAKVKAEIQAELNTEIEAKDAEIVNLKKQIGSKEFKSEKREIEIENKGGNKKSLADIFRN